jgi:two-component system OmpR family sensor kinase
VTAAHRSGVEGRSARAHLSRWQRLPLRTALALAVSAIAAVVLAVIGVATVLGLRTSVLAQLDADLAHELSTPVAAWGDATGATDSPPSDAAPGAEEDRPGRFLDRPGAGRESIAAIVVDGRVVAGAVNSGGREPAEAVVADLTPLASVTGDGDAVSIDLTRNGEESVYRVAARTLDGATLVYGLPQEDAEGLVARAAITTGAAVLLGILIIASASSFMVVRALRPLEEVAATAGRVSALPLSHGEPVLRERLPGELTRPPTEVGEVARAMNAMLDDLEAAFEARHAADGRLRRFVADAGHELRTPLATIRGYAQMLERIPADDPHSREQARERIERGADRMSALVDDLLLLARLDADDRPLDTKSIDVTPALLEAVQDAHAAAPEHRFEVDVPPHPVVARADADMLGRIVRNLLSNAWKHTPAGTRVTVRAAVKSRRVVIEVTDSGPGIPEAIRTEVFGRFVRADTGRSRTGGGSSGLGLSIVESAVRAQGGTVTLVPGDRTCFRVVLPAD